MTNNNYWDKHMGDVETASVYMESYGEGVGSETRAIISAFINDGDTVLDTGCGPGWNYEHFGKEGPKLGDYKGTDYSHYMIEGALMKYPDVKFEVGDCRDIKEADESWDVVISQDVLEHTNGYEKPISEALRVARKRVIVTFWRMGAGEDDITNDDGDDGYGSAYSRKKWEKYLDTLGYAWMQTESSKHANRKHDFYLIDKEEPK